MSDVMHFTNLEPADPDDLVPGSFVAVDCFETGIHGEIGQILDPHGYDVGEGSRVVRLLRSRTTVILSTRALHVRGHFTFVSGRRSGKSAVIVRL